MCWRDDVVRHRTCTMCGAPYYGDLGHRDCPKGIKAQPVEPALTAWFPSDVKPFREGVYQRKYPSGSFYSYFGGGRWIAGAMNTPAGAAEQYVGGRGSSLMQALPWRGLDSSTDGVRANSKTCGGPVTGDA